MSTACCCFTRTEAKAAIRADPSQPFDDPKSLGPIVNSTEMDIAPCLSADGRTLMFESDRPGGQGAGDLWQAHRVPRAK